MITRQPGNLDRKIRGFPSPTYEGFGFILLFIQNFKVKALFTYVNRKRGNLIGQIVAMRRALLFFSSFVEVDL